MKDQYSIIITAVAFAYLGVRIYQKYIRKDGKPGQPVQKKQDFSPAVKDDYEPYSGKKDSTPA